MTAMATVAAARRERRARSRLAVGVLLSLLLHAILLLQTVATTSKRSPPAPLTLTLRAPTARSVAPGAAPRVAVDAAPTADTPPLRLARRTKRGQPPRDVGVLPETTQPAEVVTAPTPSIDIDAARAQARQLARSPARRLPGDERAAATQASEDAAERPFIDALSRRIGKPLQVASETRLNDGSRRLRFVGNLCLTIPRELPWARENAFGPTLLLPSTCSD